MKIPRLLSFLILAVFWNVAPLGFGQDSAALSAQEVEQATRESNGLTDGKGQ
jgi:hypothetical protein